jgi:hypothetical protein
MSMSNLLLVSGCGGGVVWCAFISLLRFMCELASENGRVAAWEWHGICELAFNAAGERHRNGVVRVNPP